MQTAVSSAFRSDTRSEGQKRNPRPDHPFKKKQTDCKEDTRRADGPNLAAGAVSKKTWQLNCREMCPHSMGQTSVEIPDHALTPRFCKPPFLS